MELGENLAVFEVELGRNLVILVETPFGAFNVELGENSAVFEVSSARLCQEAGVEFNKDFGIRPNKWENSWASA